MEWLTTLLDTLLSTATDVVPIVAVLFGFQYLVLRERLPELGQKLMGLACVIAGLTLFLVGLEQALFPIGEMMATQLTRPEFLKIDGDAQWWHYYWVYIFAFTIGFSTTIAEPSLIAVAMKAEQVSGGAIKTWGLRIAVAIGAATGIALGTYRIVVGDPLHWYIMAGYVVVVVQTKFAPKVIIPLAYDSGGVTTSTVTVPVVAALGLGLATAIPGRSPLLDGFGIIAFAALFPIMTVMGYAQLSAFRARRTESRGEKCASN